jgi:hypothetical protein
MLKEIEIYSSQTGKPIQMLHQDAVWLNHLFIEGVPNKEAIKFKRILINTSADWGSVEGKSMTVQFQILIHLTFDLSDYLLLTNSDGKSIFLLNFLHKNLSTFNPDVPQSCWDTAYQYCIERNFQYCKRSKKKNVSLKMQRGKSCYLYAEINIEEFRLYVIVENTKLNVSQRFLVATPRRGLFNNFDGFMLKVNPDNTLDIWDGSYYAYDFRIEGIKLDLEI